MHALARFSEAAPDDERSRRETRCDAQRTGDSTRPRRDGFGTEARGDAAVAQFEPLLRELAVAGRFASRHALPGLFGIAQTTRRTGGSATGQESIRVRALQS